MPAPIGAALKLSFASHALAITPTLGNSPIPSTLSFSHQSSKYRQIENADELPGYHDLIQALSTLNVKSEQDAIEWFAALSRLVSHVDSSRSSIVSTLLSLHWAVKSDDYVAAYSALIQNIVSAHSYYVVPVLTALVKLFRYDVVLSISSPSKSTFQAPTPNFDSDKPFTKSTDPTYIPSMAVITKRTHALMAQILALIPTGSSALLPILTFQFPHKRLDNTTQIWWLKNLLGLLDYAPVLTDQLLMLVVEKIVAIEVELSHINFMNDSVLAQNGWEDAMQKVAALENIDLDTIRRMEKAAANGETGPMFAGQNSLSTPSDQMDLLDDVDGDASDSEASIDLKPIPTDVVATTSKIDGMLALLFKFISSTPPQSLPALFNTLLHIFETVILRTHKTHYTQFLLFYICAKSHEFTDIFLGLLVSKIFDTSIPSVIRARAAIYTASFVARSHYVSLDQTRTILHLLTQFSTAYITSHSKMNTKSHQVFYSVVQAWMYIFLFRWSELCAELNDEQRMWIGRGWDRVMRSSLFPLKVWVFVVATYWRTAY